MRLRAIVFCLLFSVPSTWCADILLVFAMPAYSHYTLGHSLAEELARRGHQVTMIAPYKQDRKIENYTEIYLEGLAEIVAENKKQLIDWEDMPAINQILVTYRYGYAITEFTLGFKPVLDLLNSNRTFDVVIMEQFVNEALTVFPYKFKAHLMYMTTMGSTIWNNHLVGNPAPLSYVPNVHLSYKGHMRFLERLHNFIVYVSEELYRRLIAFPYHDQMLHQVVQDAPKLNDLLYEQNPFILVNSHVSTNDPVPHVPNMVEIGGFHVKDQKLPSDLKKFLDESVEGVIYFSMGSNILTATLHSNKCSVILKALGKLKQKILWKWEIDSALPEQPSNVKISKWFPQQAILAHPNTKAFISHGGLLSTIEAVHFGVPIIGIPIFVDQKMNIKYAVDAGYAISLPYKELSEEKLSKALDEVLNNVKYQNNVRLKSALMRDRQNHPLDEAVYWVEHVIRHNGSSHFRNAGMDLKWYQYEMIDVAAFLILIICITTFLLAYCSWYFLRNVQLKVYEIKKKQ